MNTYNDTLRNRALPERSKLKFYFPQGGENNYTSVIVPFFENPIIKENKKARYKKHSLLSRSSSLYTYLGADSRQLDIKFNITIPHIIDELGKTQTDNYTSYDSPYKTTPLDLESRKFSLSQNLQLEYFNLSRDNFNEDLLEGNKEKAAVLDTITFWINVIRSSVLNNSKNPLIGPPIIRIIHGMLYRDIPCICTDYSIEINEAAGYDIDTLLPNQINISLILEEFRAGDSSEFSPLDNNVIKRDNLAGWEAVIHGPAKSLDPGGGGLING